MAADEGKAGGTGVPGGDGAEVAEDSTQVVEYAAAVDVAKGSGMVCTRVPGSRPDRRRQKTWRAEATFAEVTALMDHLRAEGIQRLVLESTSDYWRIWLRREAPCCIPGLAGRNLEDIPGSDGLLKIRKVKGTIACQLPCGDLDGMWFAVPVIWQFSRLRRDRWRSLLMLGWLLAGRGSVSCGVADGGGQELQVAVV